MGFAGGTDAWAPRGREVVIEAALVEVSRVEAADPEVLTRLGNLGEVGKGAGVLPLEITFHLLEGKDAPVVPLGLGHHDVQGTESTAGGRFLAFLRVAKKTRATKVLPEADDSSVGGHADVDTREGNMVDGVDDFGGLVSIELGVGLTDGVVVFVGNAFDACECRGLTVVSVGAEFDGVFVFEGGGESFRCGGHVCGGGVNGIEYAFVRLKVVCGFVIVRMSSAQFVGPRFARRARFVCTNT